MPGATPIRNGRVQNTLDLNNQTLTNAGAARALSLQNIGASNHTLAEADGNSLLLFSGNRTLSVTTTPDPEPGTEVRFLSSSGRVTVDEGAGVTILKPPSGGLQTRNAYSVGILTYLGSSNWVLSGNLTAPKFAINMATCCGNVIIYQTTETFQGDDTVYGDAFGETLYSGTLVIAGETPTYFTVVDGLVTVNTGDRVTVCGGSASLLDLGTSLDFYDCITNAYSATFYTDSSYNPYSASSHLYATSPFSGYDDCIPGVTGAYSLLVDGVYGIYQQYYFDNGEITSFSCNPP